MGEGSWTEKSSYKAQAGLSSRLQGTNLHFLNSVTSLGLPLMNCTLMPLEQFPPILEGSATDTERALF